MVAGGESWAYEGSMAPATGVILGAVAVGALAGAGTWAATGARLGIAGGLGPALLGLAGGALFGGGFGAAMVLIGYGMTGFPMNRGRVTITELGVGGNSGSEMDGSRCY